MPNKKPRYFIVQSDYTDGDVIGPFRKAQPADNLVLTGNLFISNNLYVSGSAVSITNTNYGSLWFSTPASTALTANIWKKIAGTTTLDLAQNVTMPQNNRLTFTGPTTRVFQIASFLSMQTTASVVNIDVAYAVNGIIYSQSMGRQYVANSSDTVRVSLGMMRSLNQNGYVEMWAKASKNTGLTITYGYLTLSPV